MNYVHILSAIFVMAAVTYFVRMLPLVIFKKKIQNRFLQSFLFYIPYAVLAAMTIPDILYSTASIYSALAGLATALILSYKRFGLLVVALGAAVVVYITEYIFASVGLIV